MFKRLLKRCALCPLPQTLSLHCLISCFTMSPLYSFEPRLLKRQTNAASNTGLPLELLLCPPFHCLGSCTLAGSSPHGRVMCYGLYPSLSEARMGDDELGSICNSEIRCRLQDGPYKGSYPSGLYQRVILGSVPGSYLSKMAVFFLSAVI